MAGKEILNIHIEMNGQNVMLKGENAEVVMIPFKGSVKGEIFNGIVEPCGVDTQVVNAAEDKETAFYNDKNITFTGDLASYDYDSILRDKQRNINSLYELSDYFVDADPIFRGIVKGVYTPFALADDWR